MFKNDRSIYNIELISPLNETKNENTTITSGENQKISIKSEQIYILHGNVCGEFRENKCALPDGEISIYAKKDGIELDGCWLTESAVQKRKKTFIPINGKAIEALSENRQQYRLVIARK